MELGEDESSTSSGSDSESDASEQKGVLNWNSRSVSSGTGESGPSISGEAIRVRRAFLLLAIEPSETRRNTGVGGGVGHILVSLARLSKRSEGDGLGSASVFDEDLVGVVEASSSSRKAGVGLGEA